MAELEQDDSPSASSCEEESCTDSSSEDNVSSRGGSRNRRVSTPQSTSPQKRCRKRVRRSNAWKKSVRKQRRNTGQRYVSDATNNTVTPKRASRVSCRCARKCFERLSEATRNELFDGFWKTANFDVQNAFICGCVKVFATKHKDGRCTSSRRQYSRIYYVQDGQVSERVCKTAFLSIFGISNGRLGRALSSQAEAGGVPHRDQRGRHEPSNKTSEEKIEMIKEHISKFPCYQSHYSRRDNPNRKYLSPDLSVSKMYALYKEHCSEQDVEAVSEWKYRHVFNTTFNLTFGRPKSDTCKTCDSLSVRISFAEESEKPTLEGELHLHHCKAERAYHQLREDTALCRTSPSIDMFTFDLEQALPTPKLATNIVFYKRQMWTYNLGIHDCSDEKGYMYMWPETVASRGSQEVGSCLLRHFKSFHSQAQHLIAFSDACGGQNRNINIVCFWMYVVSCGNFSYTTVDHKFMLSGHSYLPNDRDFGTIEKASRRTQHVFVPEEWCTLVEKARQRNPFTVKRMETDDFVSIEKVRSLIVHRKANTQKQKVEWLNIRWLQIGSDKPFEIRYRYSLNSLEAWKTLDLRKRRAGRPADVGRVLLTPLYSGPRPLNEKKLADLRVLTEFVPPLHHAYYSSLEATNDPVGSSSEDEVEEE